MIGIIHVYYLNWFFFRLNIDRNCDLKHQQ